jgi:hypothetical protein
LGIRKDNPWSRCRVVNCAILCGDVRAPPGPAWASDACMLRLQAAYAESLASASEMGHDQLHKNNSAYDF